MRAPTGRERLDVGGRFLTGRLREQPLALQLPNAILVSNNNISLVLNGGGLWLLVGANRVYCLRYFAPS